MELRQIGYAVAVADAGSFTRAAAAEHVSQPAVSEAVRRLEDELGTPLFFRLGRRVRLTPAGEAFLPPARQTLRGTMTIRAAVEAVRGIAAGRVDVVTLPTLAVDPVAAIVGAFRLAHPGVAVHLRNADEADDVVRDVLDGRAEIGFAELPAPADVESLPLFGQEIVAVSPPGTALGSRGRLPVARLAGLPLVATPPGTSTRRLVEQAAAAAGVQPWIAVETTERDSLVPLALTGAGTTFLPEGLAEAARQRGAVVVGLEPALVREVGLVHRRGPRSPAADAFIAVVQEFVAARSRVPMADIDRNN